MIDLDLHHTFTSGLIPNVCCRYWMPVERIKTNDFVSGGGNYCRSVSRDQLKNHFKLQYDGYEKQDFSGLLHLFGLLRSIDHPEHQVYYF